MAGVQNKTTGIKCLLVIVDENDKAIGGQRGASLTRTAETIDTTSKDGGAWSEAIAGYRSFSISCDGAWILGDESLKYLNKQFINGLPVKVRVYMDVTAEESSGTKYTSNEVYEGNCFITEFSYDLPYDDLASYTIELAGNGELKMGKVTQSGALTPIE